MQPTGFRWPALSLICAIALAAPAWSGEPSHGFSYFGDLKYPPDMAHFDYVNAQAPKGGRVNVGSISTFTNLNPYVDKGNLAHYISPRYGSGSYIYDPLMRRGEDELASYYCWLAESVEVADDYSWVTYKLRENARWHDGRPVTMEDVLWTFDMIKSKGSITWRQEYGDIVRLEQIDAWSFRFHFSDTAERTPYLIILTAAFAPLPKHFWKGRAFDETTLELPLGNGAYRITSVDPGYKVIFERARDYWGKDLNLAVGHYNFDEIELTYFFDKRVMLQALRAGLLDFYFEENENDWATAYDFDGFHKGLFRKETYRMGYSYGMHFGLVFNTRREPFNDIRVREALTLAYNFEWANRVYWHSGMDRNNSYFIRSGLQAMGLPSAEEIELLRGLRGQIPERVFTDPVELPENGGFGRNRETFAPSRCATRRCRLDHRGFQARTRGHRRALSARIAGHLSRSRTDAGALRGQSDTLGRRCGFAQGGEQHTDQSPAGVRLRRDGAQSSAWGRCPTATACAASSLPGMRICQICGTTRASRTPQSTFWWRRSSIRTR